VTMSGDAKRALSKTIRELREKILLPDLRDATERAYQLSLDAKKATLSQAARTKRARLEGWFNEQTRSLALKERPAARERLFGELIKDAAATLLQRIVYLRLLEGNKLRPRVVIGGWNSPEYKTFREIASDLVLPDKSGGKLRDDSEGFSTLLQLIFDELALDIPGLFGQVRMTSLVPVPAATLRSIITAFDDPDLESAWTDDTTLGWIYQYWNDPEREALDAKLAAQKKLENHEIASKTQMFTERYMVEWLLHNSLGQMWLAMCKKHGWTPDVQRDDGDGSVLDRLEARRAEWRKKREAGEVALDALMPLAPGLEDRWKYWVPQPMPDDAPSAAPDSARAIKLLDPACGSGHFLVIAFELLFDLYKEEARHRGEAERPDWSDQAIVESILENNIHGIDIDPRAVQIAAAALMLKAKLTCKYAEPRTLNLVAPNLRIADLGHNDPIVVHLCDMVEAETGIPHGITRSMVAALAGADHLGSLLQVDTMIDASIAMWDEKLSSSVPTRDDQGSLFVGFGPRRRRRITAEHAKTTFLSQLERFLAQHSRGADLGLRLRGEQLTAGVRFVRMIRESQYDLVVGNPPYQGTSKMFDKAYVEAQYARGKTDLYAAFIERGLQLARPGGITALLTMRNWMFIKQYRALREWLLNTHDLRLIGDVDRGAFDEVPNEVLAAVMNIVRRTPPTTCRGIAVQPTPFGDRSYDRERTSRKRAAVLAQVGRFEFVQSSFAVVEDLPIVYWWSPDFVDRYRAVPKLGAAVPMKVGVQTSNDERFLRLWWEVPLHAIARGTFDKPPSWADGDFFPVIVGADSRRWCQPLHEVINWRLCGGEIAHFARSRFGRGADVYLQPGVAFTTIGDLFGARLHRHPSIISSTGCSLYPASRESLVCLLNSSVAQFVLSSLNPTIHFTNGDVARLPLFEMPNAIEIADTVCNAFAEHEGHRESSIEFHRPGPSAWNLAQEWAQRSVDREQAEPLQAFRPVPGVVPPTDHLSFAIGLSFGRFGENGEGLLAEARSSALRDGILYVSDAADEHDSLATLAARPIVEAWTLYGAEIDAKRTLKEYVREKFFSDVHRRMYENRPIYFPLSSAKRTFVAYVSIHRWTTSTLTALLAEHLYPERKRLLGQKTDLGAARDSADKKAARAAEKQLDSIADWLEELDDFIAKVEQVAHKGPPPVDAKTTPREVGAKFEMDLDDGVMINSAALWPLLEPQWKDPKKWWKELANAEGKKDYDWAHIAARYFPDRVDAKCKVDPSLAVAHGRFWKYHPEKAYQWELRLQDEIRHDFTIDEPGSNAARKAFEAAHPDKVEELVSKEHQRRERKRARSTGDETDDADAQTALELEDNAETDQEELSA
jgi:hypothetical protein